MTWLYGGLTSNMHACPFFATQGLLDDLGIKVVRKSAAKAAPPAGEEEEEVTSAPAPKAKKGKKKVRSHVTLS
jgi:hypothetical protein